MDRHRLIQDMRDECECQNCKYCPLEVIIQTNTRAFEQHKIVEKFKFLRSELIGREINWNEAYIMYVEEGYAKRFAEVYKDGLTHKELEKRMGNLYKSRKPYR